MFRNLKVSSLLRRRIEKGRMTRQNLVVFIDMIQTLYLDVEYIIGITDASITLQRLIPHGRILQRYYEIKIL